MTYKGEDLSALVGAGKTNAEIAEICGVSHEAARSAVRRAGLPAVRVNTETLRQKAEQMRPIEAMEFLLEVIEDTFPSLLGNEHEVDKWATWTPTERKMLAVLVDVSPRVLSNADLIAAAYSDRGGEYPDLKMASVMVCKIRKKLPAEHGTIETVWGQGVVFRPAMRGDDA